MAIAVAQMGILLGSYRPGYPEPDKHLQRCLKEPSFFFARGRVFRKNSVVLFALGCLSHVHPDFYMTAELIIGPCNLTYG